MIHLKFNQIVEQLEKRRGGYYYLKISAETVDSFEKKKATRLICNLNQQVELRCGLNHLGDGNFFIIIAGRHMKSLAKKVGDSLEVEIREIPIHLVWKYLKSCKYFWSKMTMRGRSMKA